MLVRDDRKFPNAKVYDARWNPKRQVWAIAGGALVSCRADQVPADAWDVYEATEFNAAQRGLEFKQEKLARSEANRLYHKDRDLSREMRHQHTGELLPRDIQTYENPHSGETVKILKSASDKEKRDAIAASYERAGRPVDASEIELMNG